MATKKSGAATRKTANKPSSSARKTTTKVTTVKAAASSRSSVSRRLNDNLVNILLAELIGTFVLTSVAMMTATEILPLFVGLTLVVLVMVIGGVSGAHVNPAVTFGLWSIRKLKSALVPFYWVSQFIGAMASLLVINAVAGTKVGLDFGHFATFSWPIFFVELVGTAVFLFGLVSVLNRNDLTNGNRALGVGLSLFVGILVASSLLGNARQQAFANFQTDASEAQAAGQAAEKVPHTVLVNGATLNPAIALASTEMTESEISTGQAAEGEKEFSRLGWETILSTLIGAALGANLALLVAYRFRS